MFEIHLHDLSQDVAFPVAHLSGYFFSGIKVILRRVQFTIT